MVITDTIRTLEYERNEWKRTTQSIYTLSKLRTVHSMRYKFCFLLSLIFFFSFFSLNYINTTTFSRRFFSSRLWYFTCATWHLSQSIYCQQLRTNFTSFWFNRNITYVLLWTWLLRRNLTVKLLILSTVWDRNVTIFWLFSVSIEYVDLLVASTLKN